MPSGYFCSQTGYFLPKIWASGYFLKIKSSQTISGYFGYFLKIITNMRKVWDFINNLPQILVTNTNQVKNLCLRRSFKSKLALISSPLTNILNTKNLEKEFLNISGKIFVNKNAIKSKISGCRGWKWAKSRSGYNWLLFSWNLATFDFHLLATLSETRLFSSLVIPDQSWYQTERWRGLSRTGQTP